MNTVPGICPRGLGEALARTATKQDGKIHADSKGMSQSSSG